MGETTYDYVGIVMSKSVEGDAVARMLRGREGIDITENASLWDIRSRERLVINFEELSEMLGFDVDPYAIQYEMSTHYGRLVATDEALMLFSDPARGDGVLRGLRRVSELLEGVSVLEAGSFLAAPYAAQLLADWGADVVKAEPLDGERRVVGRQVEPLMSATFAAANRGKRSIALDLRSEEGRAMLGRLAAARTW